MFSCYSWTVENPNDVFPFFLDCVVYGLAIFGPFSWEASLIFLYCVSGEKETAASLEGCYLENLCPSSEQGIGPHQSRLYFFSLVETYLGTAFWPLFLVDWILAFLYLVYGLATNPHLNQLSLLS